MRPRPPAEAWVGRTLRFGDQRLSSYTVAAARNVAEGQALTLRASLTSALAQVVAVDDQARTVTTASRLLFEPLYAGQWLVPEGETAGLPILACSRGVFTLGGTAPLTEIASDQNGDGTRQIRVLAVGVGQPVVWEPATMLDLRP